MYAKAKVSMEQSGQSCLHEVDEFAPYERASEPGKTEVFPAFAGARYAVRRIYEWLIVRMPVITRHCEKMSDTCVERTTCHGKRKK